MKLSNIRKKGRYRNRKTGQEYNVFSGRKEGYFSDHLFYLKKGKRMFILDREFHEDHERADELEGLKKNIPK